MVPLAKRVPVLLRGIEMDGWVPPDISVACFSEAYKCPGGWFIAPLPGRFDILWQ